MQPSKHVLGHLRRGRVAVAVTVLLLAGPFAVAPARGASAAVTPADLAQVIAKVQARYDATRDFEARFRQELHLAAGGQTIESRGRVWFQRPGRMRWEYAAPELQTIVADGKHLWVHRPAEQQVLRSPLVEAFQAQAPVSFLLGVARLDEAFTARRLESVGTGRVRLEVTPADAGEAADLGRLTLEVDSATWDLVAAVVRDPLGNQTRVELRELKRNRGIDAARFRFVPPPGADVIEPPSPR